MRFYRARVFGQAPKFLPKIQALCLCRAPFLWFVMEVIMDSPKLANLFNVEVAKYSLIKQ